MNLEVPGVIRASQILLMPGISQFTESGLEGFSITYLPGKVKEEAGYTFQNIDFSMCPKGKPSEVSANKTNKSKMLKRTGTAFALI